MATKTDIVLYTASTPNGIKASIALEELGLQYQVSRVRDQDDGNEQKQPWFLDINPNGRIPALTDTLDGKKIRVFESGAILEYLADRYDKDHKISYPRGTAEHWEVTSWLMWQMGGLGPMQGQSNHFKRYAPEKIEYGINRYGNETRRLYRTMGGPPRQVAARVPGRRPRHHCRHFMLGMGRFTHLGGRLARRVPPPRQVAQDAAAAARLRKGPPRAESAYRL
ncbi:hypothetical protein J3459_018208 [Metarhizium acridum]|nr:hypothetical protein J3459_018208 [Metarhizium acridum]